MGRRARGWSNCLGAANPTVDLAANARRAPVKGTQRQLSLLPPAHFNSMAIAISCVARSDTWVLHNN